MVGGSISLKMTGNPINVFLLTMHVLIAQLKFHQEEYDETTRNAQGQTQYIDNGVSLVSQQASVCCFEIVLYHSSIRT